MGTSDELITPSEAARLLGVSADTIRAWSDAGQVTCLRTGAGHRLFKRCDIEQLARERAGLDTRPHRRVGP